MAIVTPTAAPPVQAVAAPGPVLKQPRGTPNVKTETAEAVDAPEAYGLDSEAVRRHKQRGGRLDIIV